jgi:hypothetical protein
MRRICFLGSPCRSRIRGDPLPHPHNALLPALCPVPPMREGQVRAQEFPHNTEHLRPCLCSVEGAPVTAGSQFLGLAPVSV